MQHIFSPVCRPARLCSGCRSRPVTARRLSNSVARRAAGSGAASPPVFSWSTAISGGRRRAFIYINLSGRGGRLPEACQGSVPNVRADARQKLWKKSGGNNAISHRRRTGSGAESFSRTWQKQPRLARPDVAREARLWLAEEGVLQPTGAAPSPRPAHPVRRCWRGELMSEVSEVVSASVSRCHTVRVSKGGTRVSECVRLCQMVSDAPILMFWKHACSVTVPLLVKSECHEVLELQCECLVVSVNCDDDSRALRG